LIVVAEELTKNKQDIFEVVFMKIRNHSSQANRIQVKHPNQAISCKEGKFTV
jgi:hypothetical protein